MALKVIGAGLGRTGTMSLKLALEQLGFSPCHHMVEVFAHPEQRDFWRRAAEGEAVEWEDLFGAYKASVDWPSCHFYKELCARYPDAKVILTERDPEKWYESFSQTIQTVMLDNLKDKDPERRASNRFSELIIAEKTFNLRFDKAHVLDVYRRHNAEVRRVVPKEKLLVFDAPQGWEPLCRFLGVAMPAAPFPKVNSTAEFKSRITAIRQGAAVAH
jgi:hypothetical protein